MNPIRAERVEDAISQSVLVSVNPESVMVSLTATELTITLTPEEALRLSWALFAAQETAEATT